MFHRTLKVWNLSTLTQSCSMLAHQPAVWAVSGLYDFDGTQRALSGKVKGTLTMFLCMLIIKRA